MRIEPDADHLHFEGYGELAYGTKFVVVATRSGEPRGRMILDVDWVADKGGEAKVATISACPYVAGLSTCDMGAFLHQGAENDRLVRP